MYHPLHFYPTSEKAGEMVRKQVSFAEERAYKTKFVQGIHDGTLPPRQFLSYTACIYPIVVGFCQGLGHMVGHFDAVTDARILSALYRQGAEEIGHNNIWRGMLTAFGVDHAKLYRDFKEYRSKFSKKRWAEMGENLIRPSPHWNPFFAMHLIAKKLYPKPPLPHPVLALTYQMDKTGQNGNPWIHFACQSAIETVLINLVTFGLPTYMEKHPEFFNSPVTKAWWHEHTKSTGEGKANDEERHVSVSLMTLDRYATASKEMRETVYGTLKLFVSVLMYFSCGIFPIDRYRIRK